MKNARFLDKATGRGWLIAFGILSLILIGSSWLLSKRSERGFYGWVREMEARGERFSVADLLKNRRIETNDFTEAIEATASKISAALTKRVRAASFSQQETAPGRRGVLWGEAALQGYDGWTLDWGGFGLELASMTNEFQTLHRGLRLPPADPGWNYLEAKGSGPLQIPGGKFGAFVAKRMVAQTLGNATLCELHRTNLMAASAHLRALVSMTVLHEEGLNFVNQMIRLAIAGLAASATWEALQASGWTEPELADLQRCWERCRFVQPIIRTLEMERAVALQYFDSFRKAGAFPPFAGPTMVTNLFRVACEKYLLAPVYRISWAAKDKWFYARALQSSIEALRGLSENKSWKTAKPVVQLQFAEYTNKIAGFTRYRYPVTQQVMPNLLLGFESMIRNQTHQQLTLAAIAIKRHQVRTGKLPPSLEILVPDYLATLPMDYWDGHPIRYRIIPPDAFLLYSCGKDLQDDAGDPARDAVWETPDWPDVEVK
ncbi:MAG: hypothetical protein HY735_37635 [Verrucomicrobia bacterium]|nr:hypothetical protein [Verrucomicrobiota bacterium]